jgi:Na+-transporting NADH:ubiquinone oxidoreductase subunit NqrB
MAIGVWALGTLAGLILIIVGVINSSGPVWLGGTVILLGALAWGVLKGRIVYASKIDKEYVWVSGVGREFLAVLPER